MSLNPTLNPQVMEATTLNLSGPTDVVWNSLTDGDATPDISAGTFFKTANTSATSITDFDGNTDCLIVLLAGDSNTTIVHDATKIVLEGGISVPLTSGDRMMFADEGGVWYELSRSF